MIRKLFDYEAHFFKRKDSKAGVLSINGKQLVNNLVKFGLKVGNKVKLQVDVPEWIRNDQTFSKYCLRGLVDTDGCIFVRKGKYKNRNYQHRNMYFSNQSVPLRNLVF